VGSDEECEELHKHVHSLEVILNEVLLLTEDQCSALADSWRHTLSTLSSRTNTTVMEQLYAVGRREIIRALPQRN